MNILYFAWLKSRVGTGAETVFPPAGIDTVGGLIEWLKAQSPGHAAAFAKPEMIRAAVNQEHALFDVRIAADDEVAFFPPVTGG